VIAFGCSMTSPDAYARWAKPGIELAAEPGSRVFAIQNAGSIFRSYNLILERAAAIENLEALVLVHQDAEIVDPDFCRKLRCALGDPRVGVIGCVGARGVANIAWWEGSVAWASAFYRYGELGGGELSASTWNGGEPSASGREVDALHGFMLALPAWTVRNIRFDESLGGLHGYDLDLCLQVRAAGRKVIVEDLTVAHHHSLDFVAEPTTWCAAHKRLAEKWEGLMSSGEVETSWKQRARRAEAEAAAARLLVISKRLLLAAGENRQEEDLKRITDTASWRITAPLRQLNARRRAALRGRPAELEGR
jgi:Glycosyltransferase like family